MMKQMNNQNKQEPIMILHDITGHRYILHEEISRGGQGAVFRTDDHSIAVKLALETENYEQVFLTTKRYSEQEIVQKNKAFMRLILLPLPSKANITLPIVTFKDAVGYTMKLMEDMDSFERVFGNGERQYTNPWFQQTFPEDDGLGKVLADYVGSGCARKRLHAFYLCACILAKLHSQGLVYCDFSDKNVFITSDSLDEQSDSSDRKRKQGNSIYSEYFLSEYEQEEEEKEIGSKEHLQAEISETQSTSELKTDSNYLDRDAYIFSNYEEDNVWLIDADNLNYQSVTKRNGYYTPNYGAPEVVAAEGCTFYSDCYAFAVSLFWNLTGNHPLKGEAYENYEDDEDDFGEGADEAVNSGMLPFVCDEEDGSNRTENPLIEMLLDDQLLDTFRCTFSQQGKSRIRTRPSMMEWTQVIANSLDTTITCTECRMPYKHSFGLICPWCDASNILISVESYTFENEKTGMQTGSFLRELRQAEQISIPLRIMTGVQPNSPKEIAFKVMSDHGIITISSLNPDYSFVIFSTKELIMGKYKTNRECFEIRCRNNQRAEDYYLKIGITR